MLVGAGIVTMTLTPLGLQWYMPDPGMVSAMQVESIRPEALEAAQGGRTTLGEYLSGLIPRNVFAAAATGDLMPLLIFTFLFGGAASRLPLETRRPLAELIRSLAEAMMVLVGWVLWGTPLGVFALILGLTIQTGAAAVGFLGAYIVGVCALLILVMLLLYPVTAVFGRTSMRRFARAALPAQLVAASTQSSLASLPALVEGGRTRMRLPEAGTAFILPLAVSTFKINQPISSVFKFLLLAHVFGIQLGVGQTVTFLVATILLSFSTAGVPRGGGGMKKLPLYLAAGIPIEGYVIIEAVKTIPDVFMTMTNVTADMSAATILTRGRHAEAPEGAGPPAGEGLAPVAVAATPVTEGAV